MDVEATEERHEPLWIARMAFQVLVILLVANQVALAVAVYHGMYWLAVPLVLTVSHLMHGTLIGFHEATHGLLRESRRLNEFDGVLIGVLSLTSFSLYRALHQSHHAHFGTERDEEFWPFVARSAPRWWRICVAVLELTCGLIVTPSIFFRTFVRRGSWIRNRKLRRRIWLEYTLIVVFWSATLTLVAHFHVWKYFLWVHLIPAFIAANLQSWRKYIEHVGMTGTTVNGCTRSIVAPTWTGRLVSFSLLHEPFHGVHHRHAALPHAELPMHADVLEPKAPGERPPFRSYRHAMMDLLCSLTNPRFGSHWME